MDLCEKTLYIGVIYRPPGLPLSNTATMCNIIRFKISDSDLILMGDFNLPGID